MNRNQPPRPAPLSFHPSIMKYTKLCLSHVESDPASFPPTQPQRGIDIKYVASVGPQTCRDEYAMLLNRRSMKLQTTGAMLGASTICKHAGLRVRLSKPLCTARGKIHLDSHTPRENSRELLHAARVRSRALSSNANALN